MDLPGPTLELSLVDDICLEMMAKWRVGRALGVPSILLLVILKQPKVHNLQRRNLIKRLLDF